MPKIFLDTNVILDLILVRKRYVQARQLMDLATDEMLELVTTESSLVNALYSSPAFIKDIIDFLQTCRIVSARTPNYICALESRFPDKEDAIQYFVALHNHCNYFITNNIKDFNKFESASLPAMTPLEFHRHYLSLK